MSTNPCHRPKVDSATCSSCSLLPFLFPFSSPIPLFFSLLFSLPPHPFSFPVPLFFFCLFSPPPQPFSFPVPLSLLYSRDLYILHSLPFPLSFALCLPLREMLLYFSVAKFFFPQLSIALLAIESHSYISYISYGYMVELLVMGGSIGYGWSY